MDNLIDPSISLCLPTEDDMENLVQLFNDRKEADTGLRPITKEDIKRDWASPNFDVNLSVRLAKNEAEEIIGYAGFWDLEKPAVDPWLDLRIHPDHHHTNVGKSLLAWSESRAMRCVAEVADDLRVVLASGAHHTNTGTKTLFENGAFIESRHYWEMKIALNAPQKNPIWPDGLQLVHYNTKEEILANLENIVATFDESFQDHFGHVNRPLDQIIKEWEHHLNNPSKRFDPKLWFVAMDGPQIAAICLCSKEDADDPQNGHVNILGVKRPYRRKGLGLALLLHSFQEYTRRGKTAVTLGVDASSITNATKLYEKAGMHVHRQFDDYEKELRPGKDIVRRE